MRVPAPGVMMSPMTAWTEALPPLPELAEIAERVATDANVHAVLLTGSYAHGMATDDCDVDLHLVLDRPDERWRTGMHGRVDLRVGDRRQYRRIPAHPSTWWDRYRIARGRLLLDRTGGDFAEDLRTWGELSTVEKVDALDYYLDPYLTYSLRSLHEARAGEERAAHLDALEAIPWALRLVFALHGRVRPTNRYLEWELLHHPLPGPEWDGPWLLETVAELLRNGSPAAQRELFARLEPPLRALGFGGALDGYPKAMRFLHE